MKEIEDVKARVRLSDVVRRYVPLREGRRGEWTTAQEGVMDTLVVDDSSGRWTRWGRPHWKLSGPAFGDVFDFVATMGGNYAPSIGIREQVEAVKSSVGLASFDRVAPVIAPAPAKPVEPLDIEPYDWNYIYKMRDDNLNSQVALGWWMEKYGITREECEKFCLGYKDDHVYRSKEGKPIHFGSSGVIPCVNPMTMDVAEIRHRIWSDKPRYMPEKANRGLHYWTAAENTPCVFGIEGEIKAICCTAWDAFIGVPGVTNIISCGVPEYLLANRCRKFTWVCDPDIDPTQISALREIHELGIEVLVVFHPVKLDDAMRKGGMTYKQWKAKKSAATPMRFN
jgi:hypothetical protein